MAHLGRQLLDRSSELAGCEVLVGKIQRGNNNHKDQKSLHPKYPWQKWYTRPLCTGSVTSGLVADLAPGPPVKRNLSDLCCSSLPTARLGSAPDVECTGEENADA
jgi:hypothetical protein